MNGRFVWGAIALAFIAMGYFAIRSGVFALLISPPPLDEATSDIHIAIWTMLLTCFTSLLFVATLALFYATERTLSHTKEMAVAQARADVAPVGVVGRFAFNKADGTYWWKVAVVWVNSGPTSTKSATVWVDSIIVDAHPLPYDHPFDFRPRPNPGVGLVPAKQSMNGGEVPTEGLGMSPQVVADIIAGRKFFYVWGRMGYSDKFPGTPLRETTLAWQITATGNPFVTDPVNVVDAVRFSMVQMSTGNLQT